MKKHFLLMMIPLLALPTISCKKPEQAEVIRPVYTMTIQGPESNRIGDFSGLAKAPQEIPLSFRVGGEVIKKNITSGTPVKKGDILAQLDPTDLRLEVRQKQANLAEAKAQFIQASAEYERIRGLYEAGKESASRLDQSLAEFRSAKAQQSAASDALSLTQQKLSYATLKAQVDGVIASTDFEINQNVAAGQTIATIESGDSIEFEMGVPARVINLISFGYPAKVIFETLEANEFHSTVTSIGTLNQDSTTYPVKVTLTNPDKNIRPGMVGEATFQFTSGIGNEKIMVLPSSVVGLPGGHNRVWLYDKKSKTVKPRQVVVGELSAQGIEIVSGLQTGDIIVTRGVSRLTEGMKVKLLTPQSSS